MAFGAVRHSSAVLPCRSRSGRPRPASFLGILAFLSCGGWCLRPCFCSHPFDSGAGGGGGGGGSDDDGEDAEAPLVPTKANNPTEAEGIHSNSIKNDEIEKIMLHLTTMLNFLASLDNRLMTMCDILARIENCIASNRHPSTAPVVTGTPANKDAVNRKKGFLGFIFPIMDKLPIFCGPLFIWLLSQSSAPKEGQNFEDPWMQAIITGILFFISFVLLALASNLKERESIDGVVFEIFKWLLLLLLLTLWPELCMIMNFYAHTPNFVLWPLGILFSISSVAIWVWAFWNVQPKILEELKKGSVPENGMLLEKPESEAASAPALDGANSFTVQISGAPSIYTAAPSK